MSRLLGLADRSGFAEGAGYILAPLAWFRHGYRTVWARAAGKSYGLVPAHAVADHVPRRRSSNLWAVNPWANEC